MEGDDLESVRGIVTSPLEAVGSGHREKSKCEVLGRLGLTPRTRGGEMLLWRSVAARC